MSNRTQKNLRSACAQACFLVLEKGQSLSTALIDVTNPLADRDKPLVQEICFGIMRVLPELNFYVHTLMNKVLTGKNRVLHYLLLVGIYQICYTRIPPHAAVAETVDGVNSLKKEKLKGLVNGVLREFLRQQKVLQDKFRQTDDKQAENTLHPSWLLNRIKQAYPKEWQAIVYSNNQKPPMWIRVNQAHYSTHEYQKLLNQNGIDSEKDLNVPSALKLVTPVNVNKLPSFADGAITVQDLSAQYAAMLLNPQNGEQILDLCAAPGGKTTHILEAAPQAEVLAVDIDEQRVKRIHENLNRLKQRATVTVGDGLHPENWCKDKLFDRILLDAPCSATGVIRRHPDIKWLRRESDIAELASLQASILTSIWPYLKHGGTLLYATCSILPDENKQQIVNFLNKQHDAKLQGEMIQLLPTEHGGDGFFYAALNKIR